MAASGTTGETAASAGAEERVTIGREESVSQQADIMGRPSRHCVAASLLAALGLSCVAALAALSASAEVGGVEETASFPAGSTWAPGAEVAVARRASAARGEVPCRKAEEGEPCHRHVMWAMTEGIHAHKEWYPGLSENSTFEEFQAQLHTDLFAACPRPCGVAGATPVEANQTTNGSVPVGTFAWEDSGRVVAQGQWCAGSEPRSGWQLSGCGMGSGVQVKVVTYNLFWWNLFGRRGGNGGSAGRLLRDAHQQQPIDVIGFQECDSVGWVMGDSGLQNEFAAIPGPHALCMAYRKTAWGLLADGITDVAEDRSDQWYGTRSIMWVRLQHYQTGQTIVATNHHGPLPLNSGGRCGGEATAFNILKLLATQAQPQDAIVLLGDFNSATFSQTVQSFNGRLQRVFTGQAFGGVDHVFSSCPNVVSTRNLGSGGSDHDALEVVIRL